MCPKRGPKFSGILVGSLVVALFVLGCPPGGTIESAAPEEPVAAKETPESGNGDEEPFVPLFIEENLEAIQAFLTSGRVPIRIESTGGRDECRDRKVEPGLSWTAICYGGANCPDRVVWAVAGPAARMNGDIVVVQEKRGFPDHCFLPGEWFIDAAPWRAYGGPPDPTCNPSNRPFPQVYWLYEIYLYNSCSGEETDVDNEDHEIAYYDPLVIIDP